MVRKYAVKRVCIAWFLLSLTHPAKAQNAWTGYDSDLTNKPDRVVKLLPVDGGLAFELEQQIRKVPEDVECPILKKTYIIPDDSPNYEIKAQTLIAAFTANKKFLIQTSYNRNSKRCYTPVESILLREAP